MSNRLKLEECFRKALVLPDGTPVAAMNYQNDNAWDSVAHMRLVAEIETVFGVRFTTEQILDMGSFDKSCEIVSLHGVALES